MSDGWDQIIHFGVGKQRPSSGLTGFHRYNAQGVFSGIVFRGESSRRGPSIIFATGFELRVTGEFHGRMASAIPGVHNDHGTTRGCLSFSTQAVSAAHWAAENEANEGWCYCVFFENEPWVAEGNRNMTSEAGKWSMNYQGEILAKPNKGGLYLSPDCIWGARKSIRASQSYRHMKNQNIRRYDEKGVLATVKSTTWRKGFEPQGELMLVGPIVYNPCYRGANLRQVALIEPEFQVFLGQRTFILPSV